MLGFHYHCHPRRHHDNTVQRFNARTSGGYIVCVYDPESMANMVSWKQWSGLKTVTDAQSVSLS